MNDRVITRVIEILEIAPDFEVAITVQVGDEEVPRDIYDIAQ